MDFLSKRCTLKREKNMEIYMLSKLSRSIIILPLSIFLTYNNISYAIKNFHSVSHVRVVDSPDQFYIDHFLDSLAYVLKNEAGFVDIEQDRGGITNFGISLKLVKSLSDLDLNQCNIFFINRDNNKIIENLTVEQATAIYKKIFWDAADFDKINNKTVRTYIFDMSVNLGQGAAIRLVKYALKAVDINFKNQSGDLDQQTLDEINKYDISLLPVLRSERANYYKLIVARDHKQSIFLKGWLNRAYK